MILDGSRSRSRSRSVRHRPRALPTGSGAWPEKGRKTLDLLVGKPCLTMANAFAATGHREAAELLREFVSGQGPRRRDFFVGSAFSRGFASSETTQNAIQKGLREWKGRAGGLQAQNGTFTNAASTFVPVSPIMWLVPGAPPLPGLRLTGTPEAHVIGSFNYEGELTESGLISRKAINRMGLRSFFGTWATKLNLSTIQDKVDRGPYQNTVQNIFWLTTLNGFPVG